MVDCIDRVKYSNSGLYYVSVYFLMLKGGSSTYCYSDHNVCGIIARPTRGKLDYDDTEEQCHRTKQGEYPQQQQCYSRPFYCRLSVATHRFPVEVAIWSSRLLAVSYMGTLGLELTLRSMYLDVY
jgi:hypothetical protein